VIFVDEKIQFNENNKDATISLKDGKMVIEIEAPKDVSMEKLEESLKAFSECEGCSGKISYAIRWAV
jgi:hypothetical protein